MWKRWVLMVVSCWMCFLFFLHNLSTQKLDVFPQSNNYFLKSDKNWNIFLISVWINLDIQSNRNLKPLSVWPGKMLNVSKLLLACVLIAIQPMYAVVCNFVCFFLQSWWCCEPNLVMIIKNFFVFCFSEEGLNSPKNGTRG